jgi:DNA-binding protein YbaB
MPAQAPMQDSPRNETAENREEQALFDKLKAATQLAGMLKDLPRLQGLMEDVRARLADTRVEGSAGGGAVRAVAFCDIRIDSVTLDPSVFRGIASGSSADQSYANRLIAEAVNDALTKARAKMAEEVGKTARESGIDLPPALLERLG